jgi:hypothetical protein
MESPPLIMTEILTLMTSRISMEELVLATAIKELESMFTLVGSECLKHRKYIFFALDLTSTSHCSTIETSGTLPVRRR